MDEDYGSYPAADLRADCTSCFGLCCTALAFSASSDFAANKEAGVPCRNLQLDFRCGIHGKLRARGYRGCTVYDCFGAGQKVSQTTFEGHSWRERPDSAKRMFEVFPAMRQLHELLYYLREALAFTAPHEIRGKLSAVFREVKELADSDSEAIMKTDLDKLRAEANAALAEASELARSEAARLLRLPASRRKVGGRGADLIGAKLRRKDMRGANLRGAYLIAADLREADLEWADLTGADFRDADLRGANLSGALFLIQAQIDAADGDAETRLPPMLDRPAHWGASGGAERFR